jgi:hypothetical protein
MAFLAKSNGAIDSGSNVVDRFKTVATFVCLTGWSRGHQQVALFIGARRYRSLALFSADVGHFVSDS